MSVVLAPAVRARAARLIDKTLQADRFDVVDALTRRLAPGQRIASHENIRCRGARTPLLEHDRAGAT